MDDDYDDDGKIVVRIAVIISRNDNDELTTSEGREIYIQIKHLASTQHIMQNAQCSIDKVARTVLHHSVPRYSPTISSLPKATLL